MTEVEPWLRGPKSGVHPLVAPVLYAFEQAREDMAKYTANLTPQQIWASPHGFGSVGFHIRHMAGSIERLLTYLQGRELTEQQMKDIAAEKEPLHCGRDPLLAILEQSLRNAENVVRAVDPATLEEPRAVGRKRLPTTVIGLLTHVAEHTQRHIGQAVSAAKWAAL